MATKGKTSFHGRLNFAQAALRKADESPGRVVPGHHLLFVLVNGFGVERGTGCGMICHQGNAASGCGW